MKRTILLVITAVAIIIAGCKKDIDHNNIFTNDKPHTDTGTTPPPVDTTHIDTIPVSGCDTSSVTYTGTIRTIVIANCNSCHNGTYTGGEDEDDDDVPNLTTYTTLVAAINDVGVNKFMRMLNHSGGDDYMPPSYMLTDCEIRQFAVWIRNSMPQ